MTGGSCPGIHSFTFVRNLVDDMSNRVRYILLLPVVFFYTRSLSQPGTIKRITCKTDSTHQYAFYLPAAYTDTAFYPLIIFFDPAARGDLPLNKYKSLADEMGLIMAGSFNSKNFDPQSSETAFVAIYNDIVNNYPVRAGAVWLSGFSGGARIASALSFVYKEINAVIACGAGFANDAAVDPSLLKPYAAIVGNQDMNYSELLDNNHFLDKNKANNIMIVFDGGHVWPETDHMGLAIEWLMDQNKATPRGERYLQTITSSVEKGSLYRSWQELEQLIKIPAYKVPAEERAAIISSERDFIDDKKDFEDAQQAETNYLNKFSMTLQRIYSRQDKVDKTEWQLLAAMLTGFKNDPGAYMRQSGIRCADHSYRSVMETYYHLMNTNDFTTAMNIAEVLTWFGPSSINQWYLMAKAAAMAGDKKQAEKYLKEAVKKGGLTEASVLNDQQLQKIFSQEELKQFLAGK